MIKDRNDKDLTEAEETKKRYKNIQQNHTLKKVLDPDNHDGMVTHPEPDILEWEVGLRKYTMKKASDGIPAELFHILKDDAVKVLHSIICQQI